MFYIRTKHQNNVQVEPENFFCVIVSIKYTRKKSNFFLQTQIHKNKWAERERAGDVDGGGGGCEMPSRKENVEADVYVMGNY